MSLTDRLQVAAFAVAALGQTLFLLIYFQRPWRKYVVGRALMDFAVVMWLLFVVPLVDVFVSYPGEEWVETVIFWCVPVVIGIKIRSMFLVTHEEQP